MENFGKTSSLFFLYNNDFTRKSKIKQKYTQQKNQSKGKEVLNTTLVLTNIMPCRNWYYKLTKAFQKVITRALLRLTL